MDMEDRSGGLYQLHIYFRRTGNPGWPGQGADQEIRPVHFLRVGQCAREVHVSGWAQHSLSHWRVSNEGVQAD
jgi:hypothetical protein